MAAAVTALAVAGCRQGGASAEQPAGALPPAVPPECAADALRPATAAPAEGLWSYQEPAAGYRVAAMVGPAEADAARPRITRRVETLELHAGAGPVRHQSDTASVRLEIVPPLRQPGAPADSTTTAGAAQPAAVYAVTPLVLLAAYEPCAASARTPRIRYLRRDARGAVVADVMLRRETADADGAVP